MSKLFVNKHLSRGKTLKIHLKKCNGELSSKCDVCMQEFSQSVALKEHMLVHTVGKS